MVSIILIILVFITYSILPNYYYRNKSNKVIKHIDGNNEIALTFDDGPDSEYTPLLLDLLKEHEIKATFFLVADKAMTNKEIFKRIVSEGHSVGLHSFKHKSAWLSLPWQTKEDFKQSVNTLERLGYPVKFFRPPWGTFNLLTQYYAERNNFKTILWSVEAKDWSSSSTAEQIRDRVVNNVKSGDIIVLHDSNGAEKAPERTIQALKEILPNLKSQGYIFVTIDDKLGGVKSEQTA